MSQIQDFAVALSRAQSANPDAVTLLLAGRSKSALSLAYDNKAKTEHVALWDAVINPQGDAEPRIPTFAMMGWTGTQYREFTAALAARAPRGKAASKAVRKDAREGEKSPTVKPDELLTLVSTVRNDEEKRVLGHALKSGKISVTYAFHEASPTMMKVAGSMVTEGNVVITKSATFMAVQSPSGQLGWTNVNPESGDRLTAEDMALVTGEHQANVVAARHSMKLAKVARIERQLAAYLADSKAVPQIGYGDAKWYEEATGKAIPAGSVALPRKIGNGN